MKYLIILFICLTPLIFCGCTKKKEAQSLSAKVRTLRLELYPPPDNELIIVSTQPTGELVEKTVRGQQWEDITFIVLRHDDENWLEVSGSAKPEDGFSARYMDRGKEFVSSRPPKTLDDMIALINSYLANDGRWKLLIEWE